MDRVRVHALWLGVVWNLIVWGIATYLVFGSPDHSGWWFLLAAALHDNCKPPNYNDEDQKEIKNVS